MSAINQNFSRIFPLLCIAFGLPFITTAPLQGTSEDPFDKFIEFLSTNNCSMPTEVEPPFPVTDQTPFSYLSTPLKECQSDEAVKKNNKAHLLCKEVFDVLQNITCNEYNSPLPKINSNLSANICEDFAAIQDILPEQNEYLSRKLGDSIICKVLCTEKYEILCKTLLWSYDTQAKIKKALDSKVKENAKESMNDIAPKNDNPEEKIKAETGHENHQEIDETSDNIDSSLEIAKNSPNGSSLSNLELVSSLPKSSVQDRIIINKTVSLSSNEDGKLLKSINTSQVVQTSQVQTSSPSTIDTQPDIPRVPQSLDENIQPGEQSPDRDTNIYQGENGIENQHKNIETGNPVSDAIHKIKINTSTSENKDNQNGESNTSLLGIPDKGNDDNPKANKNTQLNEKTITTIISKPESENDLNNVDFKEPSENETKGKEKQTDLNRKEEITKESFLPDGAASETNSKLLQSTAVPKYFDKNEDLEGHSEEPEQYNDSENGDYAKQEYDNAFSPSLKKDSGLKNAVEDGSSQISSSSNIQISSENFPGQGLDSNRNYLPARNFLPDQEDSHFFFYFLSIVLILMAGYLIFHNKQKIIALIVEGRHERRRRSHGAGYKKLETK